MANFHKLSFYLDAWGDLNILYEDIMTGELDTAIRVDGDLALKTIYGEDGEMSEIDVDLVHELRALVEKLNSR